MPDDVPVAQNHCYPHLPGLEIKMLDVPIAFVIFNRPEPTARSFQEIRAARPSRLFLISDAARPDRPGEAQLVQACRGIAEQVDWPCEVTRIYADQNMGCGSRISSGIT